MRKKLGLNEKTLLQLKLVGKGIHLSPVEISQKTFGSSWVRELYALFDKSRKQAKQYSGKEVDEDIERAVKAVRKK